MALTPGLTDSPMLNLQKNVGEQWQAMQQIPGITWRYWPAFFTFPLVEYAEGMIMSIIPNPSGTAGIVVNSLLRGATRVVQMATWDAVKGCTAKGC